MGLFNFISKYETVLKENNELKLKLSKTQEITTILETAVDEIAKNDSFPQVFMVAREAVAKVKELRK
jgi:hypothetical protein